MIVEVFLLSHWVAWVITLLWTGIYNYFMLKMTWRGGVGADKKEGKMRQKGDGAGRDKDKSDINDVEEMRKS